MTLGEWCVLAHSRLAAVGVEAARTESHLIAADLLGRSRSWVLANPQMEIDEAGAEVLLRRRIEGEPLAYILGWREFYGRRFSVTPSVLIPRQETELLVELCLELAPSEGHFRVLDVGTGSGCIAITLQLERPRWILTGLDVSLSALEQARLNAVQLCAEVDLHESDLFSAVGASKFDLIVSNPPYVSTEEQLPSEIANYEPRSALYAGSSGLAMYERLANEAAPHLLEHGLMILEVGAGQSKLVAEMFRRAGWRVLRIALDLAGIERAIVLRPESR